MAELSPEALRRYARHLTLPEVGLAGQKALARGSVLVVGAGGLGSPVSLYLAAAGVGRLGLADSDAVEVSNLQRQVLYGDSSVGVPKVQEAARRLADLNPLVELEPLHDRITSANARALVARYDVVVDGTDNFATRYLLNDACVLERKPLVFGSIYRFEGQVTVFDATRGPCYRCLFPAPPPPELAPSCAEGGVLGVLPGIVGTLQATQALELLLGAGEPLVGRLVSIDALTTRFTELRIPKDPACLVCGAHPTITELVDYEAFCAGPAAAAATEPRAEAAAARGSSRPGLPARTIELPPAEAARHLATGGVTLLDVREPYEWDIAHIDGARHIPLGQLHGRMAEIPADQPLIVYCHHGQRSRFAVQALRAAGYDQAYNLAGGIDRWSRDVDPAMPRY